MSATFSYPEVPLRIVQCGTPGSGNYLFYRVFSGIQKALGIYRSFKRSSGLSAVIEKFTDPAHRDFEEELEHDDVRAGGIELRNPGLRLIRPIDPDLVDLVSSLIWSHALPHEVSWRNRTHWFYILRDGRDVVASMLHKVVRPRHRAMTPSYRCETIAELLELEVGGEGFVERCARKWKEHVRSLEKDQGRWSVLRYEDMIEVPAAAIGCIAIALGIFLPLSEREALIETVRRPDPRHASKGAPGGHRDLGITARVEAVCREELELMGYLERSGTSLLPGLPPFLSPERA